jgi:hypothetical protein
MIGLANRMSLSLGSAQNGAGITIPDRYFTTLEAAASQYYTIPVYQMAVGDTVEFKFLAPTGTVAATNDLIGGDISGGSDGRLRLNTTGNWGGSGFESTILVDGTPTDITDPYPTDGKLHSVMLTSDSTLSIAALGARQTPLAFYTGIMYDVIIRNSSGVIQRGYNIDETWVGPSTVLVDHSGNGQDGTAVNITDADAELLFKSGNNWVDADGNIILEGV